eukprot:CCRYP_010389-RA/>CCRYP_010389-RA protein AED:0.00 eAED:0.00 QI:59/1/1/1/0/0/2/73/31
MRRDWSRCRRRSSLSTAAEANSSCVSPSVSI